VKTLIRPWKRIPLGARGQALAEFALVIPIFLILLFGVIEGGRFIYHYNSLNNATRDGVRYAIIHGENSADPIGPGDDAVMESVISDATFGLVGVIDDVTLEYSGPNGVTNKRGSNVNVGVTFTYTPLMPGLPQITIHAESNGVVNN
jgi:Flp pilus assembly protein TadG